MLGRLMAFLKVVVGHAPTNKMPIPNLAAVWGPNLLRPKVETAAQLADVVHVVGLVSMMIKHVDQLFEEPPPLGVDE